MTDTPKTKKRRMTFDYTDEEELALADLEQREPYKTLNTSRRMIIKHAILEFQKAKPDSIHAPATKADVQEMLQILRGIAFIFKAMKPTKAESVEGAGKVKKETAEDKDERGQMICEQLGGTVTGGVCVFNKYEVLATGRAVSYQVSEAITTLNQSHIEGQYDPSRERWEAAKIEWDKGSN